MIDINRAEKFYEAIFDITMIPVSLPHEMRVFPTNSPMDINRAVCFNTDFYKPSDNGNLVCLNASPDIQAVFGKIEAAGGK